MECLGPLYVFLTDVVPVVRAVLFIAFPPSLFIALVMIPVHSVTCSTRTFVSRSMFFYTFGPFIQERC